MATSTLQREIDAFRARLLRMEAQASEVLSSAYSDVLTQLDKHIIDVSQMIADARAAGIEPSPSWLFQQARYQELRRQTVTLIDKYAAVTETVATSAQRAAVQASLQQVATQLAPVSGGSDELAELVRGWASMPDAAIQQMVGALQANTPLGKVLSSYGKDAASQVNTALVRGLALGQGASQTARDVQSALGVTRARAEMLVRTETLRATRASMAAAYEQSGVVRQLRWSASLGPRTCGYCLSRHNKLFPLGTTMATHSGCRCSWSPALGPDLDEPGESGEAWLKRQPVATQENILGRQGAADFRAGNVKLEDFEQTSFDTEWGPQGQFGGIGHARKQVTKAGRAPDEWAEFPPPPPVMREAQKLYDKALAAEPAVTRDFQRISETTDAPLFGLDFRLKTIDSTARKIAQDAKGGLTLQEATAGIKDNLRYTYQIEPGSYGATVHQVTRSMIDAGYTPVRFKDFWALSDEGYAGVNSVWKTAEGQYVEVQFNTEAALYVKETLSHPLYERLRKLDPTSDEAQVIDRELAELWRGVRADPPSFDGISDARKQYP